MTDTTELDTLKTQLADSAARSDIQCCADRDTDGWYDVAGVAPRHVECVTKALRYLELRGLIERHPDNQQWVRVKG